MAQPLTAAAAAASVATSPCVAIGPSESPSSCSSSAPSTPSSSAPPTRHASSASTSTSTSTSTTWASGSGAGFEKQLPGEVLRRVCQWVHPLDYLLAWRIVCREFGQCGYMEENYDKIVRVPDDTPSLNSAVNMLAGAIGETYRGLVLVRPGVYSESVRVTQQCHMLGLGPRGSVVIEAPGWESALVSAGLGSRIVPSELKWRAFNTGEDACVENFRLRCRNELMRGRCVYIVNGQLKLTSCDVEGGVIVSGSRTAPRFQDCRISGSKGNGVHLTDHCKASMVGNVVEKHRGHGICIDRCSTPKVVQNRIEQNGDCGIQLFRLPEAAHIVSPDIRDNLFAENGKSEVDVAPSLAFRREDSEEFLAAAVQE